MSTAHVNEANTNEEYLNSREEPRQRYPSTNSSTPNSSGGEKQFHFTNNERLDNVHHFLFFFFVNRSGQNSRTSSLAESTTASINNEGFSNFGEIIQHLHAGL